MTYPPELLKNFRQSLFEIFKNAFEHSYTKHGIFVCGQFFPRKKRLNFSIADLGVGIRGNIYRNIGKKFLPANAINWATSGKTTRRKNSGRPGGLGFQLIKDFITLNGGRLIIVSDSGYWEFSQGHPLTRDLPVPFPGTVVTVEINTAEQMNYLSTEVDLKNIF